MRKIAVGIVITALALGAIYGAVYAGAATITLSGVDRLDGSSEVIGTPTALDCSICTTTTS